MESNGRNLLDLSGGFSPGAVNEAGDIFGLFKKEAFCHPHWPLKDAFFATNAIDCVKN